MLDLTEEEEQVIHIIRDIDIEWGRIPLTIYKRHGNLIGVEFEKAIERKEIKASKQSEPA